MSLPNYIAIGCAQACEASYARKGDDDQAWAKHVKSRLPAIGFSDIKTFISSDSELLAATYFGYRIYAWRGTKSVADIITDLRFRKTPWYSQPGQTVHSGFQHGFRELWDKREADYDLQHARGQGLKIVCTGHSLGGAKATIMAAHQLWNGKGIQGLVTFGCPRVGSSAFAAATQAGIRMSGGSVMRFVNQCDPVVTLPPFWRSMHVDSPMYFAGDGSLKDRPTFGWMILDRALLSWRRLTGGYGSPIQDHSMFEYARKVRIKFQA